MIGQAIWQNDWRIHEIKAPFYPDLFRVVTILTLAAGLNLFLAAYYFKKYGIQAPMGIHFWADVV